MWVPLDNWQAASSFQQPVVPPTDEPDAAPLVCVSFNAQWVPYVLASLMQLTQPASWNASPSAVLTVLDQATRLIELFIEGVDCIAMLEFRFTDTCTLQVSTDGGTTWTDVPGWSTFAAACFTGPAGPPGPTGPPGATGATGNTPELRWNGCTFQVSLDLGVTWSDLSGFSIPTLQGCLGGTPATPPGVTTDQMACNIANWLAVQILQGSMSSLATSIGATATTLEAALSLFGLAASWSGIGTVVFEAAGIFIAAGTAIGETALNTAAGDTTLRQNITCAIYDAIAADGSVTTANFATVLTNLAAITYATPGIVGLIHDYVQNLGYAGIAAVQGEGSLYGGTCDGCGPWCFTFDFTTGQHGWEITPGQDGHYSSGVGFVGDNDAGSYNKTELDIYYPPAGPYTTITACEITYHSSAADTHGTSFLHLNLAGSNVQATGWTPTGDGASHGEHIAVTVGSFDSTWWRLVADGLGQTVVITRATFRGHGANPFGTSNCS